MSNIERAAEVMRRELDGMRHTCTALAEALAAEGLLVTDPDAEQPQATCKCPRFSDTGGYRIADLTCPIHGVRGTDPGDGDWDDDAPALTDEQQRLIRLGKAVELFRGARQVRQDHVRYKFAWDQCLDAIYAEATKRNQ